MFAHLGVPSAPQCGIEWVAGQVTWMEVGQGGEDEKGREKWGKERERKNQEADRIREAGSK